MAEFKQLLKAPVKEALKFSSLTGELDLPGRLMAGQRPLEASVEVRLLSRQQR